ncbi:MAG: 50S ribosomal protein L6 [Chloroflexi bacterium]|nr:50S ribosomal protein L6 [Chloroflexota bacterium]
MGRRGPAPTPTAILKLRGSTLVLTVGFSHLVEIEPLEGATFEVETPQRIHVTGIDKQVVGQQAALVRRLGDRPYRHEVEHRPAIVAVIAVLKRKLDHTGTARCHSVHEIDRLIGRRHLLATRRIPLDRKRVPAGRRDERPRPGDTRRVAQPRLDVSLPLDRL